METESPLDKLSLDFKLFFAFHFSMMILIPFGVYALLSPLQMATLAICLFASLATLSVRHRIRRRWNWPGSTLKGTASALVNLVLCSGFFLFASVFIVNQGIPDDLPEDAAGMLRLSLDNFAELVSRPHVTPFCLAGIGIIVTNFLTGLKLMPLDEKVFTACCDDG